MIIQAHTESLNSLNGDFKKHHFAIIELVDEDTEILEWEQALLGEHEDRMTNIMERLIRLGHTKSSPTVVAHPNGSRNCCRTLPALT